MNLHSISPTKTSMRETVKSMKTHREAMNFFRTRLKLKPLPSDDCMLEEIMQSPLVLSTKERNFVMSCLEKVFIKNQLLSEGQSRYLEGCYLKL